MSFRFSLKPLLGLVLGLLLAFPVLPQTGGRTLGVKPAQGDGKRIALVIGNDSYQRVDKLKNARADARAMAKALEEVGFKVTLRLDANEKSMKESMRLFKGQISGGDEAVFFFSGHGVQLGAANYLLPTDITGESEDQIKDDALPLQRILDDLQDQKARFSLAIVDACRNNPFRSAGRAIGGRGLAPTSAATGQMVLFSAGAGQQALDRLGDNDPSINGLFTRIFLKEMVKPGIPVDRVLRNVREEVVRLAKSIGHEQVPALYDQALGEFYFRPGKAAAATTSSAASDPALMEMALWDSVKNSKHAAELTAYLDQYPSGRFAGVARSRLKQIEIETTRPAPAPVTIPTPSRPTTQTLAMAPTTSTLTRPAEIPVTSVGGYPNKPLRLIVPFAPGGSTDIVARTLAQTLSQRLGQPIIVENRPGAGGMIGLEAVAKSAPDGYTLLMGSSANISIASQLYRSMPVNVATDMQPVAALTKAPMMLAVNSGSPYVSLRHLVDEARRSPGRLNYATSGAGSSAHLAAVAFEAQAGAQLVHIPYKGTAPAVVDLLGGHVNLAFLDPVSAAAHIKAGKLRALAITGDRRQPELPDVPTFAELGMPGVDVTSWNGIFVPAGTPASIVRHLNAEVRRALQQQDVIDGLARMSMQATAGGNNEEFAAFVRDDMARMARWIKAGNVRID
jgi:tripartite-type tricarboxylate transporter receptor subunit TctC